MATTQKQLTAQQLALYLGQEALTDVGIGTIDTISLHNTVLIVFEGCDEDEACDFPCDEVKPILRRLDSITEEEARVLVKISSGNDFEPHPEWLDEGEPELKALDDIRGLVEIYDEGLILLIGKPKVWLYLLSLGIDLFGWIDAGLAIDKATLQEE